MFAAIFWFIVYLGMFCAGIYVLCFIIDTVRGIDTRHY
jgi:hypothetical protein